MFDDVREGDTVGESVMMGCTGPVASSVATIEELRGGGDGAVGRDTETEKPFFSTLSIHID